MKQSLTVRISLAVTFIAAAITLPSCGNSTSEVLAIINERDSLNAQNKYYSERLNLMEQVVGSINETLDSLSREEGLIFINVDGETSLSKDAALKNVERFEALVNHQRKRIEELEKIINPEDSAATMTGLVRHMREQLAKKDAQIAYLKGELSKKDVDINRLRLQVQNQKIEIENQNGMIARLDKQSAAQGRALQRQDEMINEGYVSIGTRKDLEQKNIVRKGKLISATALNKSLFRKIDIRKCRELTFEAKRPKLITSAPPTSYSLTTNGDGTYTLRITNPTDFWSISNFLVIQTDK